MALVCDQEIDLTGKHVFMFSYGSGCAASMFSFKFTKDYKKIQAIAQDYKIRLAQRRRVPAEEYDQIMAKR